MREIYKDLIGMIVFGFFWFIAKRLYKFAAFLSMVYLIIRVTSFFYYSSFDFGYINIRYFDIYTIVHALVAGLCFNSEFWIYELGVWLYWNLLVAVFFLKTNLYPTSVRINTNEYAMIISFYFLMSIYFMSDCLLNYLQDYLRGGYMSIFNMPTLIRKIYWSTIFIIFSFALFLWNLLMYGAVTDAAIKAMSEDENDS